jgi:glycosyltransferase involved in cell wall biosynthesis
MNIPRFSVVVASCRAPGLLDRTLASLRPQCERHGAELIVARSGPDTEPDPERGGDRGVIRCPVGAPLPVVRGIGLAAATGEWVALTEDNGIPDRDWVSALVRASQKAEGTGGVVLGGVMDNAQRSRGLDWGAFFAEYGLYARGRAWNARAPLLTGANVVYHRSVLSEVVAWSRDGCWEDVIHQRLAARGARFVLARDACVRQQLTYELRSFCRDRFVHGRDYARVRRATMGTAVRLGRALSAPLLPLVLGWRVWRATPRQDLPAFLRALPATLMFLGAWSGGEAWGYLRRVG